MHIEHSTDAALWDQFLSERRFRPFLQSWTMGEVYRDIGQEPVRLWVRDGEKIMGTCYGHIVPARRGRHIAIPYGPSIDESLPEKEQQEVRLLLLDEMQRVAVSSGCRFVRWSPFLPEGTLESATANIVPSPLHVLAEHVWYLPLAEHDSWQQENPGELREGSGQRIADILLKEMRKTTRNLIRRAEKDGVTIEVSKDPMKDLEDHFIRLHDETRKRHKFTPYTNAFFRAQVRHFAPRGECSVYLARYQGDVICTSVHMHAYGETSYHHGASSSAHGKIPASYLLQWRAIHDALLRGDHVYNFWGIAPRSEEQAVDSGKSAQSSSLNAHRSSHPFAGVTLFKTGFGGRVLNLTHCMDIPVAKSYWLTYGFEVLRKWRRGF